MRFLILSLLALTALPAFSAPTTPTNVRAVATGSTTVTVSWDASTGATGYRVFRDADTVGTFTTLTTLNVTGLTPSTTYAFSVSAINADVIPESSPSSPVNVTTQAGTSGPSAPTGLTGTSPTSTTVVLNWDDVPGAIEYTVYRDGEEVGTPSASAFTDTGLTANTNYEYTVDVITDEGFSDESPAISVTTIGDGSAKQAAWARAFRKVDANNDGAVSWDEFLIAKGGRLAWVVVRNRFINSDKDRDEILTLAEFADALGGRKYFAPSRLGQFLLADLDEDDLLDVDEYALTLSSRASSKKVERSFDKKNRDDGEYLSQVEFGIRGGTSEDDF